MEENRIDSKTFIAFGLMFLLLLWIMYNNSSSVNATENTKEENTEIASEHSTDSTLKTTDKAFAVPSVADTSSVTIENKFIKVKIDGKGGQISQVLLKSFDTYKKEKVYLVKDGNSNLSLSFTSADNHQIDTKNLIFEAEKSEINNTQIVTMRLKISDKQSLEYVYSLAPDSYMIDFSVKSTGFSSVLDLNKPITLHWGMQQRRMDKSLSYENRYTQLTAQYQGDEITQLSVSAEDNTTENNVNWVAFKQHLFTSILISDSPWKEVQMQSKDLTLQNEDGDFTKDCNIYIPVWAKSGNVSHNMKLYFGPSDYHILKSYSNPYNLTDLISFGWGIFGWLNRWIFLPLFDFLNQYLSVGVSIILMTIIVRLILSPVVYKSYISQAKMKVLRPEINEINQKFKDQMKRQQETMQLYRKAGVNPMSGCVPALLQLPIFLALFNFFPNVFALRQEPFLWASDLSSYDSVWELPFSIPFYGNHVSMFPILASVAIFIYTMMTMSQQAQPQQPGMPNMKFMMYVSPVMMLFFFNNYASGLSLYYFISNLITIFIMLVIKYCIIDEKKIHAQIQENKMKPKKESRFQRKMREMLEQAQEAQKLQQK